MDFTLMKEFMDRLTAWRIPGNSIRVCVENKEVFSYQSGYENYEEKIPMGSDKLYNIFSCTKPITVTAALQLYEKGYFLLDDPLYDFISEYKQMFVQEKDGSVKEAVNPITLRQLFTMTAGFSYRVDTAGIDKARAITDGRMDTLTVARCLAEDPLSFEPGERWQYGLSHDVLAAVVEVISGKKFRDYVKENIFDPLEMKESYFHNEAVLDRVAEMYKYESCGEGDLVKLQTSADTEEKGRIVNVGKSVLFVFGSEYDSGGAGITSSVSDCSKFASALANGGMGMNGERILSNGTIELMRTNQLSAEMFAPYRWDALKGYGYGLGVRTMIDVAEGGSCGSVGEFGWNGAAGASMLMDPELKLSMFYTHHMLNPQESYYQPRLRNVLYTCLKR